MSKIEEKVKEVKEEDIYGCTVVLSAENVFCFKGSKKYIKDRLGFIFNAAFLLEENDVVEDAEFHKIPVILTEQDDVSNVHVFYLRDYRTDGSLKED